MRPSVTLAAPSSAATEAVLIAPATEYAGGREGASVVAWYRLPADTPDPAGAAAAAFARKEKEDFVSRERSYAPVGDDVGSYLCFGYRPVSSDKRIGAPAVLVFGPVEPALPSARSVVLRQDDEGEEGDHGHRGRKGDIVLDVVYVGGKQGTPQVEWRGTSPSGRDVSLGTNAKVRFRTPHHLAGYTICARFTPVRNDGVCGHPVTSNRLVVQGRPTVENVEILSQTGQFAIGVTLRCRAKVAHGAPTFQWSTLAGPNARAVPVDGATTPEFVCRREDVGHFVRCTVRPVNDRGWTATAIDATSPEPVNDGHTGFCIVSHKDRFQSGVQLTTTTGKPVIWEREEDDEWGIVAEEQATYLVTANDIGHRVRAFLGEQETEPTPVIVLRPALQSYVRAAVRARSFKFAAAARVGKLRWTLVADEAGIVMKGKSGEKVGKWATISCVAVDGNTTEMVLWLDPSSKFALVPSFPGDQRLTSALREHLRDFVCATLTEFAKGAATQ
jgi:hypothetical protein